MKELQFTVYEVLGYFIPGVITLTGVYLFAVALLDARLAVIATSTSARVGLALVLIAYLLGHLTQSAANVVLRKAEPKTLSEIPEALVKGLADSLASRLGRPVPEGVLAEVSDAIVLSSGKTEARDIYVYREGFYRGLVVAFALLVVGIGASWGSWRWLFEEPSAWSFVAAVGSVVLSGVLSVVRYRRFSRYRTRHAVFAALATLLLEKPGSSAGGTGGRNLG